MGKSALGVSRFWPRVAEIQIYTVKRVSGEVVRKCLCVADDKTKIIRRTLVGARLCLLQRDTAYVRNSFHSDKVDVSVLCRHTRRKIALSTAYFKVYGIGGGENARQTVLKRGYVLYKQLGASGNALCTVLFLSHSHALPLIR